MPTWGGVLEELRATTKAGGGRPLFDEVRRKYLVALKQHTGRDVILYATKWTQPEPGLPAELVSVGEEDIQGLMEVVHGLGGDELDLILHSPGGSPEAAEAFMVYLRSKFKHIRVIVPQLAMSAATMMACAADVLLLGKHSFLGPIDPQFILNTPLGQRVVPAQAILAQFDRAAQECQDPKRLAAWLPSLNQYGPDLLVQCEEASEMTREVVTKWLAQYMLKDEEKPAEKAAEIAEWLGKHAGFKSHRRHISRPELELHGLKVEHLEADQTAQDLFLSAFHATTHTFGATSAVKIIENHLGKAFITVPQRVLVTRGGAPPQAPAPPKKP
jgi:hypothetical protein